MDWIDALKGLALLYALAGAGTVILAWVVIIQKSKGHGWFRFLHCHPSLRPYLYNGRGLINLWISELFAVCLATLTFFLCWPLVLPATMQERGQ